MLDGWIEQTLPCFQSTWFSASFEFHSWEHASFLRAPVSCSTQKYRANVHLQRDCLRSCTPENSPEHIERLAKNCASLFSETPSEGNLRCESFLHTSFTYHVLFIPTHFLFSFPLFHLLKTEKQRYSSALFSLVNSDVIFPSNTKIHFSLFFVKWVKSNWTFQDNISRICCLFWNRVHSLSWRDVALASLLAFPWLSTSPSPSCIEVVEIATVLQIQGPLSASKLHQVKVCDTFVKCVNLCRQPTILSTFFWAQQIDLTNKARTTETLSKKDLWTASRVFHPVMLHVYTYVPFLHFGWGHWRRFQQTIKKCSLLGFLFSLFQLFLLDPCQSALVWRGPWSGFTFVLGPAFVLSSLWRRIRVTAVRRMPFMLLLVFLPFTRCTS